MTVANPVEVVVVAGLDQSLPVRSAEKDLLKRVDDIIAESIEQKDPEEGFKAMEYLLGVNRVSGKALAKFIYEYAHVWNQFEVAQSFPDAIEERLGFGKVTIERYFNVWKLLVEVDIPREYKDKLQLMSIKSLIPIATMVIKQKYELEDRDWMKLANAPDFATVGKVIRKIKGTEPRAKSINYSWNPIQKTLTVWKNSVPHEIRLMYDETDEVINGAIERLLEGKVMVE